MASAREDEKTSPIALEEQLVAAKRQIATEKAGKRKLFHSIVKLADELGRLKSTTRGMESERSGNSAWHSGGLWRAPAVLPSIYSAAGDDRVSYRPTKSKRLKVRGGASLTDLFFNLVIVTGMTRVGVAISEQGEIRFSSFCYFAIFSTFWSKEAGYSTRFDTTDVSAQIAHLLSCIAALFASLSVHAPIASVDADRIMIMAAAVAMLYCCLYGRVLLSAQSLADESHLLRGQMINHAIFNIILTGCEAGVWLFGVFAMPYDWEYRWTLFVGALAIATIRVPRAFLSNDFQAAASKNGVLFILLLGFLLQSVLVVASEFFTYQTPTVDHYAFLGCVCVLFFCIKLLYVNDDEDTLAQDHALRVNRLVAFFFNIGQFCLFLSTTVLGSGLNLMTHSYFASSAALPGNEKTMVCGGFAAVLVSIFLTKSMHVKRIPTDPRNRCLFIGAYLLQSAVILSNAGIAIALCMDVASIGLLEYVMESDMDLVLALAISAVFVVIIGWLDEGLELAVYQSVEDSRSYRVSPFGFWFCCPCSTPVEALDVSSSPPGGDAELPSVVSPLLNTSIQGDLQHGYDSVSSFR